MRAAASVARRLVGLALFLVGPSPHAQPAGVESEWLVRAWTTAEGLPVNTALALAQTPDGYLWVATSAGLLRFDGLRFRLYDQRDIPGWTSTFITTLFVDRTGRLWFGAQNGEIGRVEADGHVRTFTLPPADGAALVDEPHGALEDAHGNVWFACAEGGVLRFSPDGVVRRFTTVDGLPGTSAMALQLDGRGRVWVTTNAGPALISRDRVTPYGPPRRLAEPVLASDGALWVEVLSGREPRGRTFARIRDGRVVESRALAAALSVPPTRPYRILHVGCDGAVRLWGEDQLVRWTGSRIDPLLPPGESLDPALPLPPGPVTVWPSRLRPGSLVLLDEAGARYLPLPTGFRTQNATAILYDAEGSLWVGTNAGLLRYTRRRVHTVNVTLPEPFVFPILTTRDGTRWIGSWGAGLYRFGPDATFETIATADGLPANRVRALLEDRQGRLWAGTSGGAAVLRGRRVVATVRSPTGQTWNDLLEGRDGTIYGVTDVVYRLRDGGGDQFVAEPIFAGARLARVLLEDRRGRLWVGARDGLYVRERSAPEVWHPFAPLAGRAVSSLFEDDRGTLWVGTQGSGLWRIAPDGTAFVYTRARHGLHHDGIWWIEDDGRGSFWMTSDAGIGRYSRRELDAVAAGHRPRLNPLVLTEADGMPSAEADTGQPGGARGPDGRLWFPTIAGPAIVDPSRVRLNHRTPPIHIEEATADGVALGGLPDRLPAGTHNLLLRYTALSLVHPEANQFRYRLQGVDAAWVEAGTRREVTYTNLGPGRYTFRVQGSNNDGVWNRAGATWAFVVAPLWWQTWWVRGLAFVLVLGLGTVVWRLRDHQLRTVELARLVAERTAALRAEQERTADQAEQLRSLDHAKSRFFANISHEFGTPLTLVLGPVEEALTGAHGPLPAAATAVLAVAHENALRLRELVEQLLALARLEAGRLPFHPAPGDLAALTAATARAHVPLAERKGVTLSWALPDGPAPLVFDEAHLRTALGNVLGNAVKFTPPGGLVRLTLDVGAAEAVLTVRDTGPGIEPVDLGHVLERFYQADSAAMVEGSGIGLALAKELTELHGGRIEVESEPGFGTTVRLTLPLRPPPPGTSLSLGPEDAAPTTSPEPQLNDLHVSGAGVARADTGGDATRPLVLVVDDHPDVRALVRRHLDGRFRVVEAADGDEALEAVRHSPPDLVLTDVMMPGRDGLALLGALRADPALARIPVVLLTARAGEDAAVEAFAAGADDYVEKPFRQRELVARLERLVRVRPDPTVRPSFAPEVPDDLPTRDAAFVERLRTTIAENLGVSAFTAEDLAFAVHLSKSQLNRRLKALGLPPAAALLRDARLDYAAALLTTGTVLVKEAAARAGFRDVEHFGVLFKGRFRVPPSQYPQ